MCLRLLLAILMASGMIKISSGNENYSSEIESPDVEFVDVRKSESESKVKLPLSPEKKKLLAEAYKNLTDMQRSGRIVNYYDYLGELAFDIYDNAYNWGK